MNRLSFTQPCCHNCWPDFCRSTRGFAFEPGRVTHRNWEICCLCGRETYSGIYIRVDPSTVPAPSLTK